MNENREHTKESDDGLFNSSTIANMVTSALITTFGISVIKIPFDSLIQKLTGDATLGMKQSIRSVFTYSVWRCMPAFVLLSTPRSCIAIHSKNSMKTREHEFPVRDTEVIGEEIFLRKVEKSFIQVSHISTLAFFETCLAHYPEQKLAIDQRDVPYHKEFINYRRIFASGFSLNYSSSMIGLTCLTHVNDILKKELIGEKAQNHMGWGFLTGALSGVASAVMTYPLKQLKTHINLGAVSKDGILQYPSTYSVFKEQVQILKGTPIQQTIRSCMQKLAIRSVSNALTFGVIIAINEKIGLRPYDDLKRIMRIN